MEAAGHHPRQAQAQIAPLIIVSSACIDTLNSKRISMIRSIVKSAVGAASPLRQRAFLPNGRGCGLQPRRAVSRPRQSLRRSPPPRNFRVGRRFHDFLYRYRYIRLHHNVTGTHLVRARLPMGVCGARRALPGGGQRLLTERQALSGSVGLVSAGSACLSSRFVATESTAAKALHHRPQRLPRQPASLPGATCSLGSPPLS